MAGARVQSANKKQRDRDRLSSHRERFRRNENLVTSSRVLVHYVGTPRFLPTMRTTTFVRTILYW